MTIPHYRPILKNLAKKHPKTEPAKHARKAFLRRSYNRRFSFSSFVLILTILFLFFPLFIIVFYSFNKNTGADFTGLSLHWYKELFTNSNDLWRAFANSFIIAFTAGTASTLLGTLAAVGVRWHTFRGKAYIQSISFLPMVLPEVIIGVSMLIFFAGIGIPLGMFTIFAAHTTFCLPFVFLMVLARLDEFDYSIVEAAHDLGATERQALTKVVIPAILPGVASGFLMAVTMSLEDFVITFFVSGPGSTTLPLYVYSMIRFGVSPVINALSLFIILATIVIAFSLRKFLKTIAASK
ncbi:MAG TPA: ABC transporter permease [Treponemataceae bacterium]|nr:ABC transporter permease [Treponemataceae bacterium]